MRRKLAQFFTAQMMLAALAAAETSNGCKLTGVIFAMDPIGGTLLLKDGRGYLENVKVAKEMSISRLPAASGGAATQMVLADLNAGDFVCVQDGAAGGVPRLSIVSRADVHRAQTDFLVNWQRNSVYGMLESVDAGARTLVVKPLAPSTGDGPVRVSVLASANLRAATPNARHLNESAPFKIEELKAGEVLYVRGTPAANGGEMKASLVIRGGYRGILGTLLEVQAFSSVLRIREFGSGRTLSLKVPSTEVFRTTENVTHPMRVETASGVVLAPVGLADLQTGDAILIVGRTTDGSTEGDGLVAVTKFGTFGVSPKDPQDRISWLLAK